MTTTGMIVITSTIVITRITTTSMNTKTVRGAFIGSKGIMDMSIGTVLTRGNGRPIGIGVTITPMPFFI